MGQSREERVMHRAYEIWEREGRPQGRQEEHWRRAEQEIGQLGGASREGEGNEVPTTSDAPAAPSESPPS